ncbi:uncharacterized protein LOC117169782 [Belonocnema kinseyi]|uniref:uncharacterized protein LOC117169782 n=1 Tax=Belonocnema kinseyi TaxID=2817044 RepID=UPI00143D5427|nr:uncharacterized protein LOC117169782 [Belonocnema kinseyi]
MNSIWNRSCFTNYDENKHAILSRQMELLAWMRFRKGEGRKKEWSGRWKGIKLEEVKEHKYLGYILQTNGDNTAHVREWMKQAAGTHNQCTDPTGDRHTSHVDKKRRRPEFFGLPYLIPLLR